MNAYFSNKMTLIPSIFKVIQQIIDFLIIIFIISILIFSKETFEASKSGIQLWFNTVLPALLPFIIGVNLLMSTQVVFFLGKLIEPIMYPIFRVSGIGGFAWIMGMLSGYPIGAKITADLRRNNLISTVEAQRLISFTNNCGPLFILGAVAVGILNKPELGWFIIFIQVISSITVGLLFRFYKCDKLTKNNNLVTNQELFSKKSTNILNESIINAMQTMITIGGFIILFFVIIRIITLLPFYNYIQYSLNSIYNFFNIEPSLKENILLGIIEMMNGVNLIGVTSASLLQKLIIINFVIVFGGFSIHAQTYSMISGTDIKFTTYLFAKIIQSILAGIYTLIFFSYWC